MRWSRSRAIVAVTALCACGPLPLKVDGGGSVPDAGLDAGSGLGVDAGPQPFADRVVSFTPGPGAGFGQGNFPQVVLGPPHGAGSGAGSTDVLSLGNGGEIVLAFDREVLVDGPGVDLLVFENPFVGFVETGFVAASDDGVIWHEWPCDPLDVDGGYPGCAGVHPVFSSPENAISPTDPATAGGDGFDLATIGLSRARFVRIRDSGANRYAPPSGGFDLDAVAIVHAVLPDGGVP